MERLTKRVDVGGLCEIADVDEQDLDDAIERLADYEDTGHMPEDIEALKAENEMLRATIEAERKIKLETMHDFLDKYEIDYDCGWRDAVDMLIDGLRAENQHLKDEVAVMREALKPFAAYGKLYKDSPICHPDVLSIKTDRSTFIKAYEAFAGVKEADNDQR